MNFTFNGDIIFLRSASTLIALSVIAVFIAIGVDFFKYNDRHDTRKSRRSIVATGSMIGFYMVYYLVIRFRIGARPGAISVIAVTIGTLMIIAGTVVNIAGRVQLGRNWANHIKIYQNHTLMQAGLYAVVRHPLYASIMLMLFGGSLAYSNWLSAILTAAIFVPFMNYRAGQEEALLSDEFPQYDDYARQTGRFFPKLRRRKNGQL